MCSPSVGELLIAGERNDGERWYYALTDGDRPCLFYISFSGVWDEADAIVWGFGLRLLKSADYVPPDLVRERYDHIVLCVNERGEVIGEA